MGTIYSDMFICQPPATTVCVAIYYQKDRDTRHPTRVEYIKNDGGVRLRDIMEGCLASLDCIKEGYRFDEPVIIENCTLYPAERIIASVEALEKAEVGSFPA